jgi:superfamily II DNA or RNA helicase
MEITEDWVRGLTGWKPFKDGKALVELVSGFKRTGEIVQGTLKEGRLTLRPTVKIAGPSDVRVQCGCAEHRATGGVCAHAVAVLLAALAPTNGEGKGSAAERGGAAAPVLRANAWAIFLSPRFATELPAGRLSLRLTTAKGEIGAQDQLLSAWLAARKVPSSEQAVHLRLAGAEIAEFLDLVAGHPRVEVEGRKGAFRIEPEPGPPLRLADSRLEEGRVALELAEALGLPLGAWGEAAALVGPDFLQRLPAGSADPGWLAQVAQLVSVRRLGLPLERFLANFDAWMDLFEPPQPGWLGALRLAGAEPDFELELEGSLEAVDALLKVRYPGLGAVALPGPRDPLPGLPRLAPDGHLQARNPLAEARARALLVSWGFQPGSDACRFRLRGKEEIQELIADGLPLLRSLWCLKVGERFEAAAGRVHVVRPEIEERGGGGDSLVFELSFQTTGGKRIPGAEVRRLLRGGQRSVKLAGGAQLVLSRSCEELVQPLVEELGIGRPDEPFQLAGPSSILFRNLRDILQNPLRSSGSSLHSEVGFQGISNIGLNATLRPYQEEGAGWLADRLNRLGGALLADEMGLGKTLQTIASINHFKQEKEEGAGVVLVVAPTSLLGNWMAELKRFAPGLKTLLFHGAGRDKLRGQIGGDRVVVTSYGTVLRDLAFHLQQDYRLIVADEASLLRNPEAETSKALFKLKARGRVALTGTPVENRMQDLWSIFRFIAPGYLGSRADFKERYEAPAAAGGQMPPGLLQRMRLRTSPFVLRRTKEQVAKDLPDKVEIDEWLDLSEGQAELYASLARAGLEEVERIRDKQGEGAGRMHLLTLLLRLRQVCVDPGLLDLQSEEKQAAVKIERLLALLDERSENGLKTLVFSQFAQNLRRIQGRIPEGSSQVFRIDGSTRKRQELVDSFQSAEGPAVFLISLKAGGYGLNLTAADAVVHMDPWWNPAVEAQATDRAHRIGQTRPVTVYRLLTRNTVEERVRRLQESKRAIIDAATGDVEAVPRNWTADDIESLLR